MLIFEKLNVSCIIDVFLFCGECDGFNSQKKTTKLGEGTKRKKDLDMNKGTKKICGINAI